MSSSEASQTEEIANGNHCNVGATRGKKRSAAHDHFIFCPVESKYKCNYCPKFLAKEKASGTGNLLKHLRSHHPNKLSNDKIPNPAILDGPLPKAFNKPKFSPNELEKLLVEFILMTDQPFNIVEAESFLKLINYSRTPQLAIPKRDAIRAKIQLMYNLEKDRICEMLKNAPGKISLIVDCWTTRNGNSFHGILATFVDENWNYQQVVLDFDVIEGSHTGKVLASSVLKTLEQYGIKEKLLAVTSDNASNMDTMLSELRVLLAKNNIDFKVDDQRFRCLAHIINLSCQAALKILKVSNLSGATELFEEDIGNSSTAETLDSKIQDSSKESTGGARQTKLSVYDRLKRAVNRIRNSNVLQDSLNHFCDSNQIPKLKILNDMPIRWNSTLKMLKRCLQLRKALDATMRSDDSLTKITLTDSEWNLVQEMVNFLEPFNEMTERTSKQHLPLMSLTAAIYIELYTHLESFKIESGHNPDIVSAAKLACDKLNVYYPKTDGLVYLLGIDPRCKLQWHKIVGFEKLVQGFRRSIAKVWNSDYKKSQVEMVEDKQVDDIIERQMKRLKYDERDELDKYLSESPCKLPDNQNNVLLWWKEHESVYPQLSKMAIDYLGVAATGVPVECMFSMGTDLLTPKRLSMIAETIQFCLCLKAWLKLKGKQMLKLRAEAVAEKMLGVAYN